METNDKKISPFDIIGYIFTNEASFENLADPFLEQNFFILNRTFAIKYPLQAQAFNELTCNYAEVVKSWKNFLRTKEGIGKVPYWTYTKGSKRTSEIKDKKEEISSGDLKLFASYFNCSLRDAEDLKIFYPQQLKAEIEAIKKIQSIKEQEKQIVQNKVSRKDD